MQLLQEDFVGENNTILYVEQGLVDIVGFAGLQTVEMIKVHQCESK